MTRRHSGAGLHRRSGPELSHVCMPEPCLQWEQAYMRDVCMQLCVERRIRQTNEIQKQTQANKIVVTQKVYNSTPAVPCGREFSRNDHAYPCSRQCARFWCAHALATMSIALAVGCLWEWAELDTRYRWCRTPTDYDQTPTGHDRAGAVSLACEGGRKWMACSCFLHPWEAALALLQKSRYFSCLPFSCAAGTWADRQISPASPFS